MVVVRCERCRYAFEAAGEGPNPSCRQCGGPTVAVDAPREVHEEAKTVKLATVPAPPDDPADPA
ncbi:MAG TPA: hypothetical protein VII38_06095 [Polyangia bacterium]|jgi:rRNA maturation endonuclease Nob1